MTLGPGDTADNAERGPRPAVVRLALAAFALLMMAGFVALGTWQLQRLAWKRELIARVEQRVHAPAVAAPGAERWEQVTAAADEYRHVSIRGTYLYERTTRVLAATELGSGFWLLTPLCGTDGRIVLVNRGFVPASTPPAQARPGPRNPEAGACHTRMDAVARIHTVTGLLRISEPGGAFLRQNDPNNNRWYSRDVEAIAAAHGLTQVAPYFVDADAAQELAEAPSAGRDGGPAGGLTVISFHNNHMVYALTWYALAAMVAGACLWLARDERRARRRRVSHTPGISRWQGSLKRAGRPTT
jgi:surfeit locus 1 family protein